MIGKPVPADELENVLARQAERDRFVKQIEGELKALKQGECLRFIEQPEAPLWLSVGLALLVDKIKGLKMIKEGNCAYIYREK